MDGKGGWGLCILYMHTYVTLRAAAVHMHTEASFFDLHGKEL